MLERLNKKGLFGKLTCLTSLVALVLSIKAQAQTKHALDFSSGYSFDLVGVNSDPYSYNEVYTADGNIEKSNVFGGLGQGVSVGLGWEVFMKSKWSIWARVNYKYGTPYQTTSAGRVPAHTWEYERAFMQYTFQGQNTGMSLGLGYVLNNKRYKRWRPGSMNYQVNAGISYNLPQIRVIGKSFPEPLGGGFEYDYNANIKDGFGYGYNLGLRFKYSLGKRWELFADLKYEYLVYKPNTIYFEYAFYRGYDLVNNPSLEARAYYTPKEADYNAHPGSVTQYKFHNTTTMLGILFYL